MASKPEFDWNAVNVGDYELDHSQNFFGNSKTKVMVKEEDKAQIEMSEAEISAAAHQEAHRPLRMQWTPMGKTESGASAGAAAAAAAATGAVPKAYAFKEIYETNRLEALRQKEQENRQLQQFHSRPMPNFKALHKRIEDRVVVHRITVPSTPQTVRYWKACVERRRLAMDNLENKEPASSKPRPNTLHPNQHNEQRVRKAKKEVN